MVIEIVVLGYSRVVVARLKTESIVYILFTDFLKNVFNVLSFLFAYYYFVVILFQGSRKKSFEFYPERWKGRFQSSRKKRGFPGGSVKQNEKFPEIPGVHGKIDLKSKGVNFEILRYISSATCLGYRIQRIMIFEEKV